MYLPNKYTKWYNFIIKRAQIRMLTSYTEKHHIVPKSMGGSNAKENLAILTAREHFVCHLLLVKMTTGENKSKMAHAAWRMCCANKQEHGITARAYEKIRTAHSTLLKRKIGVLSNRHGKPGPNLGKPMSAEAKAKSSATKLAKKIIPWNKGIPRTEKEKAAISAACRQK
jgi:hypothetical protein